MESQRSFFRRQIMFWGVAFAALLGFVWLFNDILLPFILGIAVAYMLNPLVRRLGDYGYKRQAAAIVIISSFMILIVAILALIIPVLIRETAQFIDDLPYMSKKVVEWVAPYQEKLQNLLGQQAKDPVTILGDHAETALSASKTVLVGVVAGGAAVTSFLTIMVIMPIVAFFMMKEWPKVLRRGRELLPRPHEKTIITLLKRMDRKIAGFVRGQLIVAAILGAVYAVTLSLAGLKYGFLIGLLAGMFNIIPLVGSTLGLIAATCVGYFQTGDIMYAAIIGGIFIGGQIVEGNILTPRVMGQSVGLHPLWVFFALMAGGALFGIVGMLIAIPVIAVASVLMDFLLEKYKQSAYYLGPSDDDEDDETTKVTIAVKPVKAAKPKKKVNAKTA